MYDTDFDKQKLMYHPKRVACWKETRATRGPIYTEMELTTRCNHQCIFCGVDHIVNRKIEYIDNSKAIKAIAELEQIGNKSIMFSGHGEPLLHKDAAQIIKSASLKMSTSLTTNGAAIVHSNLDMIDKLEWIRFSVNGCDPENYAEIHNTKPEIFARVMTNIEKAVARKKERGLKVTIGTQLVLLEQNADGIINLAIMLKNMGVDYFSVKPYSQHPLSRCGLKINYNELVNLEDKLRQIEDKSFKIAFRYQAMKNAGKKKPYEKCYGTHFSNFISADGNVWECNVFAGDPRFLIGNIYEQSMAEIWQGAKRKRVLEYIENDMTLAKCRPECRMNHCNQYLWRLKNPRDHDNFI